MRLESRHKVWVRKSWYFSLLLAILALVMSTWMYSEYKCCGTHYLWSSLWTILGMLASGWTVAVWVLIKQGRI
jgi:hypothetical protein